MRYLIDCLGYYDLAAIEISDQPFGFIRRLYLKSCEKIKF